MCAGAHNRPSSCSHKTEMQPTWGTHHSQCTREAVLTPCPVDALVFSLTLNEPLSVSLSLSYCSPVPQCISTPATVVGLYVDLAVLNDVATVNGLMHLCECNSTVLHFYPILLWSEVAFVDNVYKFITNGVPDFSFNFTLRKNLSWPRSWSRKRNGC